MRILLDTCTFLWLAQEPDRISPTAAAVLDEPANSLWLGDVSIWEITLKHSAGKLPLPDTPRQWIPAKLAFHQVQTLPLGPAVFYRAGELPRLHPDPFDRLLAAQAIEGNLLLVSPDVPLSLLGAPRVW